MYPRMVLARSFTKRFRFTPSAAMIPRIGGQRTGKLNLYTGDRQVVTECNIYAK